LVLKVFKGLKVTKGTWDHLEVMVMMDQLAPRGLKVTLVMWDLKEMWERRE